MKRSASQTLNPKFQIPKRYEETSSDTREQTELAKVVMARIEALGRVSEEQGRLTRTFCSEAMRRANDLVGSWMREAGMKVREDAIGNLTGYFPGRDESGDKVLLIGSHLDTVRDAGKFDGALGVLVGIACVQKLFQNKERLPFAIKVIGFADEEGVRYQTAYLGSRIMAGTLNLKDLKRTDSQGATMAEAIRRFGGKPGSLGDAKVNPKRLIGYVEAHIEQGPVLEEQNLGVGVVSAISGQSRVTITFRGVAGHAGTTPMNLRRDALCAAAEFVLETEAVAARRKGLVATVGEIVARPGASNVIAGETRLSLDVRHPKDQARKAACAELKRKAQQIARERNLHLDWQVCQENASVNCDRQLSSCLSEAVKRQQKKLIVLPSGAGHDAAALAKITKVAMLFVRCRGGISHHPSESASLRDIRLAIAVMNEFIWGLACRVANHERL